MPVHPTGGPFAARSRGNMHLVPEGRKSVSDGLYVDGAPERARDALIQCGVEEAH
jgi:hypothetical protein